MSVITLKEDGDLILWNNGIINKETAFMFKCVVEVENKYISRKGKLVAEFQTIKSGITHKIRGHNNQITKNSYRKLHYYDFTTTNKSRTQTFPIIWNPTNINVSGIPFSNNTRRNSAKEHSNKLLEDKGVLNLSWKNIFVLIELTLVGEVAAATL